MTEETLPQDLFNLGREAIRQALIKYDSFMTSNGHEKNAAACTIYFFEGMRTQISEYENIISVKQ